jgi:hypothetical protein
MHQYATDLEDDSAATGQEAEDAYAARSQEAEDEGTDTGQGPDFEERLS